MDRNQDYEVPHGEHPGNVLTPHGIVRQIISNEQSLHGEALPPFQAMMPLIDTDGNKHMVDMREIEEVEGTDHPATVKLHFRERLAENKRKVIIAAAVASVIAGYGARRYMHKK